MGAAHARDTTERLPTQTWDGDEPELAGALGTAASALWSCGQVEQAKASIAAAGGPGTPTAPRSSPANQPTHA